MTTMRSSKIFKRVIAIIMCIITALSMASISASAVSSKNVGTTKTGTYYTIKNLGSNKMLNVYGSQNKNNVNITVYSNDGTAGQQVKGYSHGTMKYDGVTFTKYYFVFKCATSRALNVYGSSCKTGSNVCLWSKSGNDTQDWILEYVPSKSGYIIRSANNPKYVLTATGSSNSSNVCLKAYSSSNNYQIWQSNMFKCSNVTNNTESTSAGNISSKTLSINWDLIKSTGKQGSGEKNCLCRALAYSRDIIDGYAHSWTEYSEGYLKSSGRYSYTAVCSKASYSKKTTTSQASVYKAVYDNINNGKPVIINVDDGAGKRSTGCHYVAVVGYTNVSDVSKLTASNFLIIDSVGNGGYKTENLGSLGYYLRSSGGYYTYYID